MIRNGLLLRRRMAPEDFVQLQCKSKAKMCVFLLRFPENTASNMNILQRYISLLQVIYLVYDYNLALAYSFSSLVHLQSYNRQT